MGFTEMNAVRLSPSASGSTTARNPRSTPRSSSFCTRWCTAEVDNPMSLPRSV